MKRKNNPQLNDVCLSVRLSRNQAKIIDTHLRRIGEPGNPISRSEYIRKLIAADLIKNFNFDRE